MEQKVLPAIESFFQFALLGVVASGYLAIAGSGYVDAPTVILAGVGLLWRAAIVSGARRLQIPELAVTIATIAYMAFAPIDYFFLSHTWITASVHVVFFVASVKTLTARSARDYLFVAAVAFIELLAGALFSASGTFFFCLAAYLLCAVAALSASEVRRMQPARVVVARMGQVHAPSRLAAMALVMTFGILLLSAGLFFVLPRTANAALRFLASNRYHLTGFSNDVTLGEVGELKSDSRPVMHVKPLPTMQGGKLTRELPLNQKWRGLALEHFDGHRWSTDPSSFRTARPEDGLGLIKLVDDWQRRRVGNRSLYRVEIQNVDADALFVAGTPEFLNAGGTRVSRSASGALRFGFVPTDTVRYEVYSFLRPGGGPEEPHRIALTSAEREQDLVLPPIDSRIGQLARRWTAGAYDDAQRAAIVEMRLRRDYGYSLDLPASEPRDPVASFLFERRTGYCEYFASAMTVMLRTLGIPARLVNGFQSGIANPYSGTLVIRASDAHTWVEAFLPQTGWTVFDPTPLAGRVPQQTIWSKLALYADAADTFWRDWVLSYDLGQQLTLATRVQMRARDLRQNGFMAAFEWVKDGARTVEKLLKVHAAVLVSLLLLGTLAPLLIRRIRFVLPKRIARRGRSAPKDATVLYERMLETLKPQGYQKPAWFTADEFAVSVHAEELDRFTAAYYAVRFGGDSGAAREMVGALDDLHSRKVRRTPV